MNRASLALLLAGCAVTPLRLAVTPPALAAASLEGTWHVQGTTFPLWLEGTKRTPRFTYSNAQTREGVSTLDDLVSYEDHGETGTIEGVDTQSEQVPTHFTWRGRGLLALFKSEWDLVYRSPDGTWAVITFSPTLATPSGLDVISRSPTMDDESWVEATKLIEGTPELKALSPGLQRLPVRGR